MFEIELSPLAIRQLRGFRRFDSVRVLDAVERFLKHSPERHSPPRIKRLKGRQQSTFRLREGEYRIFYDVSGGKVTVVAVLHKNETADFYRMGEP